MTRNIPPVGIITGTGVSEQFDLTRPSTISTPFGNTTAYYQDGEYIVVPRHGAAHRLPPHAINYRANIAALEKLGVKEVIATNAVGSMVRGFGVGEIGLIEQFLDFTKRRQTTFFENRVVHTDMTNPYSGRLNLELSTSAKRMGVDVRTNLVYVCVEGPRFETAAEIKMYKILGGDVVGMTGVPEVVLANEKKLEYASVVIVTNWAAGMQPKVSQEEVLQVMRRSGKVVKRLIESTVEGLTGEQN